MCIYLQFDNVVYYFCLQAKRVALNGLPTGSVENAHMWLLVTAGMRKSQLSR